MNSESAPTTDVAVLGEPIATTVTFVDFVESTIDEPQRASTTLDVARHHGFTGEITFAVEPSVSVFLDGGVVYHAAQDGDVSLSRILLDAGVVDVRQLDRGVIRVGDVEHLGRLFDRDATIDRDAVMVVVENRTEQIVNHLADHAVASATASAYRHHASGIHRWFVAPVHPVPHRPASDELSALDPPVVDGVAVVPTALEVQAELDLFDADGADWSAGSAGSAPLFASTEVGLIEPVDEFHIVWPDGSEGDALSTDDDDEPLLDSESSDPELAETATETETEAIVSSGDDPTSAAFEMTTIDVHELPVPDATVPTDVADAVKRALAAMSQASGVTSTFTASDLVAPLLGDARSVEPMGTTPDPAPSPDDIEPPDTAVDDAAEIDRAGVAAATAIPTTIAAPAFSGFAPPTLDMRAEAIYERAARSWVTPTEIADDDDPNVTVDATVVDVADEPDGQRPDATVATDATDASDRKGALRRLIGSLRKRND